MPFSPETLEEKPYNICISCPHIGKECDGPNFLAMSIDRWCEWCHLRKEFLGWTNKKVAEISGVSKVSVDRIMSGDTKDLRISTMQAVTKALVNGCWGQSPCMLVLKAEQEIHTENPVIVAQCQHIQDKIDKLSEEYKAEVVAIREEAQKKIDFLLDQIALKDKQIEWMQSIVTKEG